MNQPADIADFFEQVPIQEEETTNLAIPSNLFFGTPASPSATVMQNPWERAFVLAAMLVYDVGMSRNQVLQGIAYRVAAQSLFDIDYFEAYDRLMDSWFVNSGLFDLEFFPQQ